jgi:diguanylate cyclase (GGDEF)-like protein/PAS domain S-box-containing protein
LDGRSGTEESRRALRESAAAPVPLGADTAVCRQQLELKSKLLENIGDGILAHTLDGRIVYANHRMAEMLGYRPEQLAGLAPWGWVAPNARSGVANRVQRIRPSEGLVYETSCLASDGLLCCVEVHSRVFEMEPWGTTVVSVARDMAERSAVHETMHRLAFYDTLTGLSNRSMLDDRIEAALLGARYHGDDVGLIYMDLDDFKPVNDTHGHGVGDCVLRIIAERMLNCVRDTDTVARVGGDEFIALFPRLHDRLELGTKARQLAECISQPISLAEFTVRVSVSVGLATYVHGEHNDELIKRADHAMYRAKLHGLEGWEEFLASA